MIKKIEEILRRIKSTSDNLEKQQGISQLRRLISEYREYLQGIEREIEGIEEHHSRPQEVIKRLLVSSVDIQTLIDEGWRKLTSGKYQEAMTVLRKAKKLAPDNVRVYILLGWAYIHLNRFDEAMAVYQQALKIDPENQLIRANLGYINYKLGIYGEAIEKLSRIVKNGSDREAVLYAHLYLGLVYFDREMYDDAIEFLEKTVEMAPNLYEARYYLGISHLKKGNRMKGENILKSLAESGPKNVWSKKAMEAING